MKIFTISGLGADERVFKNLTINAQLIHIPWIPFQKSETMQSYAIRLVENFEIEKNDVLIGVSFGGMLASELATCKNLQNVILISSASEPQELPLLFRIKWPIKLIPNFLINLFKPFLALFFGTKDKALIKAILKDSNPEFIKNAIHLILNWKKEAYTQLFSIHGNRDLIIPCRNRENQHIIPGGHLMIVDESEKISQLINQYLSKASLLRSTPTPIA